VIFRILFRGGFFPRPPPPPRRAEKKLGPRLPFFNRTRPPLDRHSPLDPPPNAPHALNGNPNLSPTGNQHVNLLPGWILRKREFLKFSNVLKPQVFPIEDSPDDAGNLLLHIPVLVPRDVAPDAVFSFFYNRRLSRRFSVPGWPLLTLPSCVACSVPVCQVA